MIRFVQEEGLLSLSLTSSSVTSVTSRNCRKKDRDRITKNSWNCLDYLLVIRRSKM